MAFNQYILVGESDIYDKQGFRKAIFLQMAGLIQQQEELEDGTPNPHYGWVVQSEKWVAERLGISESAVYKAIKTFVQDGWWIREERRDSHGHLHCRWSLAEGAQERLREAKRGKGPRVTNPKKANNRSFKPRGSEPTGSVNPLVSVPSSAHASVTAASPEASRLGACWPDGSDTEASRLGAGNDVELDVSVFLSDRTIAIADVSSEDQDTEQKTAGETPATPTLDSIPDFSFQPTPDEAEYWDPVLSNPLSPVDLAAIPSCETEPARWLANYLFCFLTVREDVEILPGWEKFWTNDFQEALNSGCSLPDLKIAIRKSQVGKAREYFIRATSIVQNLERLVEDGRKLEERGFLKEVECPSCHGLFVGEAVFDHSFECYRNKPADPEDVAEEEAMYLAEELVSEGYVTAPPDMQMFYPWPPDDVPEQLPEPTGEQYRAEEEQETRL